MANFNEIMAIFLFTNLNVLFELECVVFIELLGYVFYIIPCII